MRFFSGRRLTVLGIGMIAIAAGGAVRVAVSGGILETETRVAARPSRIAAGTAARHVALALSAERRGDVAAALSHYRAAVMSDPQCVDRRSPGYLGDAFEEKLKGWIAGMKSGRIAAGPGARDDASFIFRSMYGGCG